MPKNRFMIINTQDHILHAVTSKTIGTWSVNVHICWQNVSKMKVGHYGLNKEMELFYEFYAHWSYNELHSVI